MASPTYNQDSIKKMKAPGVPIVEKDSSVLSEGIGVHNTTAPNLADGDYSQHQLDDLGNLKVIIGDPAQLAEIGSPSVDTATNTKIEVGFVSTTVLALNADRIQAIIVNDSDEAVYVNLSATAVMNEGIRLNASGGSLVEDEYTGVITAICSNGSKNITVVEK